MPAKKTTAKKMTNEGAVIHERALQEYGAAMRLFAGKQDWAKAQQAFTAFLDKYGDVREALEMADRARIHLDLCRQHTEPKKVVPSTGEEWMVEAVVLANEGRTDDCLEALAAAEKAGADLARVLYVKAAALSVAERREEALEALAAAIEADPENRIQALQDRDIDNIREMAGYVQLVEPPEDEDSGDMESFEGEVPGSPVV